jgi:hypothetical protein
MSEQPIDSILEKEQTYKRQMTPIREIVLKFAEQKNWSPMSRGRKAHVSIHGPVNGLNGVIDIEIERLDWDDMPNSLTPDYPFTLWCSASKDLDGVRFCAETELYWQVSFIDLPTYIPRFLDSAWAMLSDIKENELVPKWPGPSANPDLPPDFGPPRRRKPKT